MTPQERIEAAGRWLVDHGGQAKTADLGAAFGLNKARQADVQRELRLQGLADGPRGVLRLTTAGWARFALPDGPQSGAGEVLETALADWPQRLRAFIELIAASVIARHHLAGVHPVGHLGFMALGPTGTGKSSAGQAVCRLFGWDPVAYELYTPAETTGSLLGRRVQSAAGWSWEPSPTTRLPFVVLDEFGLAEDAAVQRAAFRIFQGKVPQILEGQVVDFLPTPLATANPPVRGDRYAYLPEAARRRSVLWDSADMAGRGVEVGRHMARLEEHLARHPGQRLHLDKLRPPQSLSREAIELLESGVEVLTEAGRREYDARPLQTAALGRCALMGEGADDWMAALATLVAYLQVTESRPDQVLPDWPARIATLREYFGQGADAEQLMAMLRRGSEAQQTAQRAVQEGRQRAARAELEVLEDGAALAERIRRAREAIDGRKVPEERKDEAAGLRRVLGRMRTTASQVTTRASLAAVRAEALEGTRPLERAEQLARDVAAAAAQRATQAREAKEDDQRAKRDAVKAQQTRKALENGRKQDAADDLRDLRMLIKTLEKLYARTKTAEGESPLTVLAAVVVHDQSLLTYIPPAREPAPELATGGLRQRWQKARHERRQQDRPGLWQAMAVAGALGVAFEGWPGYCAALQSWGPNTRAVLRPVLRGLHAVEDQLRATAGGRSRVRPELTEPALPPPAPLHALPPAQRLALPPARRP